MNLRRTILVAFIFSFSVFFMVMAMRQMEWHQVLEVMSNGQLYPWLLFSTLCYLTGHLVRGMRTRLLVSHDTKLSVLTASIRSLKSACVISDIWSDVLTAKCAKQKYLSLTSSEIKGATVPFYDLF